MSSKKKIIPGGVLAVLLLVGVVILWRPWARSPEVIPPGSRGIQLPDPSKLGAVLPAESLSPSGPRVLAPSFNPQRETPSASPTRQEPPAVQGASSSRQKAPKAFTPPPEAIRKIKREGSVIY